MRPFRVVSAVITALSMSTALPACTEDKPEPLSSPSDDGGARGATSLASPALACADGVEAIYSDPGPLTSDASARGNVLRCAEDKPLTKELMQAELTRLGYAGKPLTSGARVYRIAYRTERGNAAGTPSVSSAFVMIPDVPRSAKLPIVVASRGSRGQAPSCAVTKLDPSLQGINEDFERQAYALAGAGYAVIAPDLAGYANAGKEGNPASGYAQATDVARSTLDGARALAKLFPALDAKVVLVGHSQGGHTALSALALAETYGMAMPIVGVAVYAPLWLSQRSWGAVLFRPVGRTFPIASSTSVANVSVWYHYTQAELLDGPGEGEKLFAADKRAAIKNFVETQCWGSQALTTLGATYIDELFAPDFVSEVPFNAVGSEPCDPSKPLCTKWLSRYSADRPHLTGAALKTPILLAYGSKDTTIPPDRMKCAYDRLVADSAKLTVCVDPDKGHSDIVSAKGDHIADWIGNVALGEAAPPPCAASESALPSECNTPPPND